MSKKKLLKGAILVLWIGMVIFIIYHNRYNHNTSIDNKILTKEIDEWSELTFRGKKVGYAHLHLSPETKGYSFYDEMFLKINLLGTPQSIKLEIRGITDKHLSIETFTATLASNSITIKAHGFKDDKLLNITYYFGKIKREEKIDVGKELLFSNLVPPYLALHQMLDEKDVKIKVFDPLSLSVKDLEVRHIAKEGELYHLSFSYQGIRDEVWIDSMGMVHKEKSPIGISLKKVSKESVLRLKEEAKIGRIDLARYLAVPVIGHVPESANIIWIKYKIEGMPEDFLIPSSMRQRVEKGILTIYKEKQPKILSRCDTKSISVENYIGKSRFVDPNQKKVKELAERISSTEPTYVGKVKSALSWVHKNIKQEVSPNIPASWVALETGKGDCNEQASLLVAILRAMGFPSRVVGGLLYQEGYFYYHAWVEICTGNSWISIDPIKVEFPVSPYHIKLFETEEGYSKVGRLLGRIKVRVVGYTLRKNSPP